MKPYLASLKNLIRLGMRQRMIIINAIHFWGTSYQHQNSFLDLAKFWWPALLLIYTNHISKERDCNAVWHKVYFNPPAWQQTSCKSFKYFFFLSQASILWQIVKSREFLLLFRVLVLSIFSVQTCSRCIVHPLGSQDQTLRALRGIHPAFPLLCPPVIGDILNVIGEMGQMNLESP